MKKCISTLLIIAMAITSFGFLTASNTFSVTKEQKIKAAQKKLKEKQKIYNQIKEQAGRKEKYKNQVLNEMDELEEKIAGLETELEYLKIKIYTTKNSIEVKNREISEAQAEMSEKKKLLNARVRTMYKMGNVGYIEVILGSRDFADLMTRIDIMQRIYDHDKEIVDQLREAKIKLEVKKGELMAYNRELAENSNILIVKKRNLKTDVSELEVRRKKISKDLAALEEREKRLSKESAVLRDLIFTLQNPDKVISKGPWAWPVPTSKSITATYGYSNTYFSGVFHRGIDIGAPHGTTIVAAKSGRVIYADWQGSYGNVVMIDHGGGMVSVYGHQSRITSQVGQNVKKGEKIGEVGTTGNSTGNHLHFEVRKNGNTVDPKNYVY